MTSAIERTTPPPWREVFAGARGRLTTGLLLLEALVAIEALIVATILPAVAEDLGGVGALRAPAGGGRGGGLLGRPRGARGGGRRGRGAPAGRREPPADARRG